MLNIYALYDIDLSFFSNPVNLEQLSVNVRTDAHVALIGSVGSNLKKLELSLKSTIISELLEVDSLDDDDFSAHLPVLPETVRNMQPLQALSKLKHLELISEVEDISFLAGLLNLETLILDIRCEDPVCNLSSLRGLRRLKTLFIKINNSIHDITPLADLQSLESLDLIEFIDVQDFSPLRSLKNLRKLQLYCSSIEDLSVLNSLTELRFLSVTSDDACKAGLPDLRKLRTLDISRTNIKDIASLRKIPNLELHWRGQLDHISKFFPVGNLDRRSLVV